MYNLPHFKEPDEQLVLAFVKQHPFAMLIGVDAEQQPVATQVPLLIDQRGDKLYFTGHIHRKTDHHRAFEANSNVLAVFSGPHTYVSASWYETKEVASTWNYMSVHAKGTLHFLNEHELLEILKQTTTLFENNPHSPALVEKMPVDYIKKNMKAIIGFEIEVKELNHVFKLSQNHDKKTYENIIHELKKQGGDAEEIAKQMDERKSKLFEP